MVYFLKLHVRNYVRVIRILTSSRQGVHFPPPTSQPTPKKPTQIRVKLYQLHWSEWCSVGEKGCKGIKNCIPLLIRQKKSNLKTEVTTKQSTPDFPQKLTFLTPWYAHVGVRIRGNK